jgi:hypothetical protein
MRYFTYLAEQSFKTDAEGRRVFYLGGPFSRPFVVSDPTVESRLFRKLTWHYRIFLSALIVGQAFLLPQIIRQPPRFFLFLGATVALQWLVLQLVFFADLRTLPRAPARLSLRTFYAATAQRHSVRGLLLGLIGSLAFVVAGATMLFADFLSTIGITVIVLLGASAVAWGYALKLKLAQNREELS